MGHRDSSRQKRARVPLSLPKNLQKIGYILLEGGCKQGTILPGTVLSPFAESPNLLEQ